MSDFLDKARELANDDQLYGAAEDMPEEHAMDGGTLGSIADSADDVIDQIQGTKD